MKKFRSQVRLFGKNQVYLVEVITNFLFFWYLIFKADLININNPRNLGMLPRNVDIICENIHPGSWDSCPKIWGHIPGFWEYIPGMWIALTVLVIVFAAQEFSTQVFTLQLFSAKVISKCNSHSWDILPETWDMTPCFRVTIPGSWVYILVKKCRSQVRLFGKNQVYLVEVITIFCLFDTLSIRLI